MRIYQLINLQYKVCHLPLSIALVPAAYLQPAKRVSVKSEEEGVVETTLSNVLNF